MGYLIPAEHNGYPSTFWAHRRRSTPSTEPGTDFYMPWGTWLVAPMAGVVSDTGDSVQPFSGRYVTLDLDDGRRCRFLHLMGRVVSVGDRVTRGQPFARSGASGYGTEWYGQPEPNQQMYDDTGGPHVHVTLFKSQRTVFGAYSVTAYPDDPYRLDPEDYFTDTPSSSGGSAAGGFLMALNDAQQKQLVDDVTALKEAFLNGRPEPEYGGGAYRPVDLILSQTVASYALLVELQKRVRGEDPNLDILQLILSRVGGGEQRPVDVDEVALADLLAPALEARLVPAILDAKAAELTDAELDAIAKRVNDVQAERLRS